VVSRVEYPLSRAADHHASHRHIEALDLEVAEEVLDELGRASSLERAAASGCWKIETVMISPPPQSLAW